jgi:ATP-dependent DNA ligase
MLPAKPCLPSSAPSPPIGPEWLHEIKHDGYQMLAHHDGARIRLISRRGLDWGWPFPTIIAAVHALGAAGSRQGRNLLYPASTRFSSRLSQ